MLSSPLKLRSSGRVLPPLAAKAFPERRGFVVKYSFQTINLHILRKMHRFARAYQNDNLYRNKNKRSKLIQKLKYIE